MSLATSRVPALAIAAVTLPALVAAGATVRAESTPTDNGVVAIKAGTIHLVEDGRVLEGGATILVKNGKIQGVGTKLEVPPHAQVIDYGPDAVIVPGLVAPFSPYATGSSSPRTAAPGLRAVDGFDSYGTYSGALSGGVTSAYITPAEGRLIGGVGALVKLAGDDRIINERASIHGAIDATARSTPGFWEPPIPATVDTGMGFAEPQLPRSTMGAIVALTELVEAARSGDPEAGVDDYGYRALRDLRPLLEAGIPWRIRASETNEIRAILEFATDNGLSLILDSARGAAEIADEIADAGASVVFRVPFAPNRSGVDAGRDPDARWPSFDVPAALVEAGVRVAISGNVPDDLLFSAALASRGGLDPEAALRAITLTPAELSGGADRVGSIRAGKDADFCVLNGEPFTGYSTVIATWVEGEVVWETHATNATVIEVDELHVGDGTVLRPGQILMKEGLIVEVAERVAHPRGAKVVRGVACMPGMIDAFGYLGLGGSTKVPSTDFKLETIVGPGDAVDRRVATHGITTVVLTPRAASRGGAPVMAYKPAGNDLERQVVRDPVALRLKWTQSNRLASGKTVRELLAKAAEYRDKWLEYETAIAGWTPPVPEPEDEAEEADDKDDEKKKEEADDEKKDTKKKRSRKKKKKAEPLEPDPITGSWSAELESGASLKMRLLFALASGSGEVRGNLRCDDASDTLVDVIGYWDRDAKTLNLTGLGSMGWVSLEAALEEKKLEGKVIVTGGGFEFSAIRASKDYVVAKRAERDVAEDEKKKKKKKPKGKPKKPRIDPKLEPLRSAMDGNLTVVVEVDREDEILECVEAFEGVGIEPVLYGAGGAYYIKDELAGRIRGLLLSPRIKLRTPKRGTDFHTPYADLQNAGIPIAFHSGAEEGSIDIPLAAAYAVANGMSPTGAVRALTSDAAEMMAIDDRVGRLERGLDADVLLLDGSPLAPGTSVRRTWVDGEEVR